MDLGLVVMAFVVLCVVVGFRSAAVREWIVTRGGGMTSASRRSRKRR